MTFKNTRVPPLCYFKLWASFRSHWWVQTGVTVWKRPIGLKIGDFLSLEIWQITLTNNGAPLLCHTKLCASFRHHVWIQTGVTVRKWPIRVKTRGQNYLSPATLKFDRWPWKTIGHLFYATSIYVFRSVAVCEFKLEIRPGKAQIGAKRVLTIVTFTFDLWHRRLEWTLRLSMVTTENFMIIWWQEHSENGVMDGRTDKWTGGIRHNAKGRPCLFCWN